MASKISLQPVIKLSVPKFFKEDQYLIITSAGHSPVMLEPCDNSNWDTCSSYSLHLKAKSDLVPTNMVVNLLSELLENATGSSSSLGSRKRSLSARYDFMHHWMVSFVSLS